MRRQLLFRSMCRKTAADKICNGSQYCSRNSRKAATLPEQQNPRKNQIKIHPMRGKVEMDSTLFVNTNCSANYHKRPILEENKKKIEAVFCCSISYKGLLDLLALYLLYLHGSSV